MVDIEELKARHKAEREGSAETAHENPGEGAQAPFSVTSEDVVLEILRNAQEAASSDLQDDVLWTRRVGSALLRQAYLLQALIVVVRQHEYLAGEVDCPSAEIRALGVLAALVDITPAILPNEMKTVKKMPDIDGAARLGFKWGEG